MTVRPSLPACFALCVGFSACHRGSADEESGAGTETSASSTGTETSTTATGTESTGETGTATETGEPGFCGDGSIDNGELCDDGDQNGMYGACAADCQGVGPYCGDGNLDGPEECDDGNEDGLDACDLSCQPQACGDDVAQPGELCFDPFVEHAITGDAGALLVLDLDGDMHLDLVVADVMGGEVVAAFGDGTGSFTPQAPIAAPPLVHELVARDFDGDQISDVLVVGRAEGWLVLRNDGGGVLTPLGSSNEALESAWGGDLDGDQKADLIVGSKGKTELRKGAGDGTFSLYDTVMHDGWVDDWQIVADLDLDQNLDVVLLLDEADSQTPLGEVHSYLGSGGGAVSPLLADALADDADRVIAAPIDGDAYPDLVVLRGGQPCRGLLCVRDPVLGEVTTYSSGGQAPGNLEQSSSIVIAFDPTAIAAADLDADSKTDVAIAYFAHATLDILRGHGNGDYTFEELANVGVGHVDIALADVNEDGHLDIIMTRSSIDNSPGVRVRLASP